MASYRPDSFIAAGILKQPGIRSCAIRRNHHVQIPACLIQDGTGLAVKFCDIPKAITCGKTRNQAIDMAPNALVTAMDFYLEDKRAVPPPS
ncbi:type II toxin-antitoxin system HicB family antitoxin [Caballeronia terrestris]|uniref:type II toxin-antitoxin system HicB family antitoxin n=1 Tax=Caballeronia terrestris TaxID=1226301 RepID=UPI000F736972|nr:hypothetical protein [Caballeronia terrestris]